jgi:oligopeptide transport system permease protein
MAENVKISPQQWEKVPAEKLEKEKISRPSLTYWQDAWRRLKKNHLSMLGLVAIIALTILAIAGPMMSQFDYSDQDLTMSNLPSRLEYYKVSDNNYIYLHKEYRLYTLTEKGEIIEKLTETKNDMIKKYRAYEIDGKEVVVDYSFAAKAIKSGDPNAKKFEIRVDGEEINSVGKVRNKTYKFGTDHLGRDLYVRVLYGARISLLVGLIATVIQFFIGVTYGGISGYTGGRVDNIMMRIVDIIATIPLLLYVILLMVVMGAGLKTIIIALGSVYWVTMARIVRGQVLSIKEQEYVLAARTIGASTWRIMARHLIPNAMGSIIVALAMNIPSAIFTEAFLSFIGLGVSAPMASWGTLANDALGGLRTYAYQLFYPSVFIAVTVLAFNFLGDGLRDALDPRLRK